MPAEKKHIGVSALPGSASTQSSVSSARAAAPSGATVTVPHPCDWKNDDRTSLSWPASSSSGCDTPVWSGNQAQND